MQDVLGNNQSQHVDRSVAARLKALHSQQQQNQQNVAADEILDGLLPVSEARSSTSLGEVDKNVVRLIGQYLKSHGLNEAAAKVVEESGCKLENSAAARFRTHIINGNWDMVLTDLKSLKEFLNSQTDLKQMKFIVLEQKFLEFLEGGDILEAIGVLRTEMAPLQYDRNRLHELSTFLMVPGGAELRRQTGWRGGGIEGRQLVLEKLQAFLPPTVMLPPKRLEQLLKQAWMYQVSRCQLHNGNIGEHFDANSILVDHHCKYSGFPITTRQILHDHIDEVLCALFSPCGKFLATGAKESAVYIWRVNSTTKTVSRHRTLEVQTSGAAYLSWSPDGKYLAVAGLEDNSPDIYVFHAESGGLKSRISQNPDDSLAVIAWHKCGRRIACGGQKGQFYQCDIDNRHSESWEGFRIRGIWCKNDGRTVLASDTHNRIRAYTFDDMRDYTILTETTALVYFCLDASERYALCTTKGHGLHLWDLETRSLIRHFAGSKHGDYIIFSCFGGYKQNFVATGSEDNCVYIWNRDREDPVQVLRGHTAVVNAVSWNPADPSMLASCSDDGTVRIWGPDSDEQLHMDFL